MSETDDTDDLLLIPPDFFVIDTEQYLDNKLFVPYYSVFDTLITQVNSLESRLSLIEFTSADNSLNNSLSSDHKDGASFMYGQHKPRHFEENPSTQSTPQKPRTKFKLSSLPSSPSERFSPRRPRTNLFAPKTAQKPVEKDSNNENDAKAASLAEIDTFIESVNAIRKFQDQKINYLNMQDVDRMLTDLEKPQTKQRTWRCGDNVESIPDLGFGARTNLYGTNVTALDITEKLISDENVAFLGVQPIVPSSSVSDESEKSPSPSSSDLTQATAYKQKSDTEVRGNEVTNFPSFSPRKCKNKHSVPISSSFNFDGQSKTNNLRLLSLKDLWSQSGSEFKDLTAQPLQKLEEERLRRLHCERLITELQTKILELQERLAVAIKVDQAKDEAISRFRTTWMGISGKLQSLEMEKQRMEEEIERVRRKNETDLEEAAKKVMFYEKETAKAMNLTRCNQEKLLCVEKQCNDFKSVAQNLESNLRMVESNYAGEYEKNKKLMDIIAQKDVEIGQNKQLISDARKEIIQSKKAIEATQSELTAIKTECTQLRLQIHEERQKFSNIDDQKKKVLGELELAKNKERTLKEELEKQKQDLRSFYQNQVEVVVQEKLHEFQSELERVEGSLKEDYKSREFSVARTAAVHIQQISEKHSLEVSLLEEKHREEVRLYQIQITQYEQQTQNLLAKYQKLQQRWNSMAQKMEAQLLETMKIFTISRTPSSPHPNEGALDQINYLKSKSASHLKELLSFKDDLPDIEPKVHTIQAVQVFPEGVSSVVEGGDVRSAETPVSSKPLKKRHVDQEIQKYIQMLLSKSSGGDATADEVRNQEEGASTAADDKNAKGGCSSRERKGKPPWK